jgi:hypothetical protein
MYVSQTDFHCIPSDTRIDDIVTLTFDFLVMTFDFLVIAMSDRLVLV